MSEFKGKAAGHGAAVGTVRFIGLAAGPPDSEGTGPWVHADVTIDGLEADTDYCLEVHEFGNLRYVSLSLSLSVSVSLSLCLSLSLSV